MPFNPSPQSTNPFPIPSITPQPLLPPLTSLSFLRFFSFMCLAVLREIWIFLSLFFCFVFVAFICICAGAANQAGSIKSLASACGPTLPERQGEIHLASEGPSGQVVMARSGRGHRKWKEARKKRGGGGGIQSWGLQGRGDAGTTRRRRGDGGGLVGWGFGDDWVGWGGWN